MLLLTDLDTLRQTTQKLKSQTEDLRKTDETLRSELLGLSGSLEYLAGNNEDRWRSNDLKWVKNSANFEQWTKSIDELEVKVKVLENLPPQIQLMNTSTVTSLGRLTSNVTQLEQAADSLKSGLAEVESILVVLDKNTAAVSNTTVSIKGRVQRVDMKVDKLQADTNEFLNGFTKLVDIQVREILKNIRTY